MIDLWNFPQIPQIGADLFFMKYLRSSALICGKFKI